MVMKTHLQVMGCVLHGLQCHTFLFITYLLFLTKRFSVVRHIFQSRIETTFTVIRQSHSQTLHKCSDSQLSSSVKKKKGWYTVRCWYPVLIYSWTVMMWCCSGDFSACCTLPAMPYDNKWSTMKVCYQFPFIFMTCVIL